jgi:hypothetical protein
MKAFLTGGMFWVNQYGDRLRPLASAASSHLIAAAVSRGFKLLGLIMHTDWMQFHSRAYLFMYGEHSPIGQPRWEDSHFTLDPSEMGTLKDALHTWIKQS